MGVGPLPRCRLPKDKTILVCLSGRGDKDLELIMDLKNL